MKRVLAALAALFAFAAPINAGLITQSGSKLYISTEPRWTNPDPWVITFTVGEADTVSFADYAPAGAAHFRLHESSAELPEGVTLDSENKQFVYDGSGEEIEDVTGIILEDYEPEPDLSDWEYRISGEGVVWYHNFDNAEEVNRFRWTGDYGGGNDPLGKGDGSEYVTHVETGGPGDGGGYMRLTYPSGSDSGRGNSYWWRPFNAFTGATNGRGEDDPGANGDHTPVAWNVTDGSSYTRQWTDTASNPAYFGPSSSVSGNPSKYYGTDFYVQLRHRRADTPGPPPNEPPFSSIVGKSAWFNITLDTSTPNEIVVYGQGASEDTIGQQGRHRMYEGVNRSGGPSIGGENMSTSINNSDGTGDWRYSGGWDTFLYHITPGTNGGTGSDRTRIEVWAAQEGETSYTKIWDVLYSAGYQTTNSLGAPGYDGWNAFILAIYHNGSQFSSSFNYDYDQVILSEEFIPCPQD
jgi:hypothetical protein